MGFERMDVWTMVMILWPWLLSVSFGKWVVSFGKWVVSFGYCLL